LADNVNLMAANLTARNIAEVTTAVDNGDLSVGRSPSEVRGEILDLKNNTMNQLNSFACEVTRVAREMEMRVSWVPPTLPARADIVIE